jgi:hypothetical protein
MQHSNNSNKMHGYKNNQLKIKTVKKVRKKKKGPLPPPLAAQPPAAHNPKNRATIRIRPRRQIANKSRQMQTNPKIKEQTTCMPHQVQAVT